MFPTSEMKTVSNFSASGGLLEYLCHRGWPDQTVRQYLESKLPPDVALLPGHDVDRKPGNVLDLVRFESHLDSPSPTTGEPPAFDTSVIRKMVVYGHVFGYDYKDFYRRNRDVA